MAAPRWKSNLLAVLLSLVSNLLMLRDRLLRATRHLRVHQHSEPCAFPSGTRTLAATWVSAGDHSPVVLLCHGIGETVEHWSAVQALFRDHGIGSLVFNYSGYARSSGRIRTEHCDEDLVAAHSHILNRIASGAPVFLLGFSLGSGIAAAGASALQPPIAGLFLCESFDSFRNAALAAGAPRWMTQLVPDVWNTANNVADIKAPICIMHSDADKLFPVTMPQRIAAANSNAELIIIKGLAHNEPYMTAAAQYWLPVIERIKQARP